MQPSVLRMTRQKPGQRTEGLRFGEQAQGAGELKLDAPVGIFDQVQQPLHQPRRIELLGEPDRMFPNPRVAVAERLRGQVGVETSQPVQSPERMNSRLRPVGGDRMFP